MSENIKPIGGSWGAAECLVCGRSWNLTGPIETETPRCPSGCYDEALQCDRGPQTNTEVIEALFADVNRLTAQVEALMEYVEHKGGFRGCATQPESFARYKGEPAVCTCGLDDLLAACQRKQQP